MKRLSNIGKVVLALGVCIVSLTSCLKSGGSSYSTSDDASISYFYLKQNDSIEGLEDAVFTIDNAATVGLIYNKDSLPFGTRVDSVYPSISFTASSVGSIRLDFNHKGTDTTVYYTGSESIDFTQPVTAYILSSDGTKTKQYTIKVNVHTLEPELYTWKQICNEAYAGTASMQQAVFFHDSLLLMTSNGSETQAYVSADGSQWSALQGLTGLPPYADLTSLKVYKNMLYFVSGGKLYSSANGRQWTSASTNLTNLLFVLKDKLWGISATSTYSTTDGTAWTEEAQLPSGFPQLQFASCVYQGYTKQWSGIVMGGYDQEGQMLDARWVTENGREWQNMATSKAFQQTAGGTLICYDHQLMLFGAVDKDLNVMKTPAYWSDDDGLHWEEADTTYLRIVQENNYEIRGYTRAVVSSNGYYIYLIGGRTRTQLFKDVWKGRKNDIDWE